MDLTADSSALLAALEWQIELGADECIGESPVDRYALPAPPPPAAPDRQTERQPGRAKPPPPVLQPTIDPIAEARAAANAARDLPALAEAVAAFSHCDLRHGARNTVFADGLAGASLMILGEAPGREEDQQGRPFVGPAGQFLDRMLAAIGRDRSHPDPAQAVYITNVLPWRPPRNRDPLPEEIAMLKPFVERHIALADPQVLILMGNIACEAMLGKRGITKLRGHWTDVQGRPAMPMFHPAYLLRKPHDKPMAWADLLTIQARLRQEPRP